MIFLSVCVGGISDTDYFSLKRIELLFRRKKLNYISLMTEFELQQKRFFIGDSEFKDHQAGLREDLVVFIIMISTQ